MRRGLLAEWERGEKKILSPLRKTKVQHHQLASPSPTHTSFVFYWLPVSLWHQNGLLTVGMVTWEQCESDGVDAILLGGSRAFGVGDVHLELHWFLEHGGAGRGFVFCPETRLRHHTVTEAGNLREKFTPTWTLCNYLGFWCLFFPQCNECTIF